MNFLTKFFIARSQYAGIFQGNNDSKLKEIPKEAVSVLTFYQSSAHQFIPDINQLEQVLEGSLSMQDQNNKLNQDGSQNSGLSLLITTQFTLQDKKRAVRQIVPLNKTSSNDLINIFSMLRNVNGKGDREQDLMESPFSFSFHYSTVKRIFIDFNFS